MADKTITDTILRTRLCGCPISADHGCRGCFLKRFDLIYMVILWTVFTLILFSAGELVHAQKTLPPLEAATVKLTPWVKRW